MGAGEQQAFEFRRGGEHQPLRDRGREVVVGEAMDGLGERVPGDATFFNCQEGTGDERFGGESEVFG